MVAATENKEREGEAKTAAAVQVKNIGLRGVTVADTKISQVDGENGILIYRGYRIEDLVQNSTFEETAYLVLHDDMPTERQLEAFRTKLKDAREVPAFVFDILRRLPRRSPIPWIFSRHRSRSWPWPTPDLADESREANIAKAIRLIARIAAVVAGWQRIRNDLPPLASDAALSHAGNFLWLLTGKRPDAEIAHDLDTILVLHVDHIVQRLHVCLPRGRLHSGPYVCQRGRGGGGPFRKLARRGQRPGHEDAPGTQRRRGHRGVGQEPD